MGHLHPKFNFTESTSKTTRGSLHDSCEPTIIGQVIATLEPSELRLSLTRAYTASFHCPLSPCGIGHMSVPILPFAGLQRLVYLVNSRPLPVSVTSVSLQKSLSSRSYEGILSSSSDVVLSTPWYFYTRSPVSVSSTVHSEGPLSRLDSLAFYSIQNPVSQASVSPRTELSRIRLPIAFGSHLPLRDRLTR